MTQEVTQGQSRESEGHFQPQQFHDIWLSFPWEKRETMDIPLGGVVHDLQSESLLEGLIARFI